MSSIQDLPDDSLYLASVDRLRDFALGVLAETVTEVTIGSGEKKTRAALVSVDFSTNLPALAALERLPEPSLGGTVPSFGSIDSYPTGSTRLRRRRIIGSQA